jgi:hypothetical protein
MRMQAKRNRPSPARRSVSDGSVAAFDLLRWRSQESAAFDHVLLTADVRIAGDGGAAAAPAAN